MCEAETDAPTSSPTTMRGVKSEAEYWISGFTVKTFGAASSSV